MDFPLTDLKNVDITNSGLFFDMRMTPNLEELHAKSAYAPFQLAHIWHTPSLVRIELSAALHSLFIVGLSSELVLISNV